MHDRQNASAPNAEIYPQPIGLVPALVVSGFLGAGKTSVVRSLLREAQELGIRLAVVSNEFGELGIDRELLRSERIGEYVELQGGCVCCKLSDELLSTLQNIWDRTHPDRIVVETSGVALPFETLMTFWREPVSHWVGESLAVVVVNAEQLAQGRDLDGIFEQQVSSADLLILNKIDLVPAESLDRLESLLAEMAPGVPVIRSLYGYVDSRVLFAPLPRDPALVYPKIGISSTVHGHEFYEAEDLLIEAGIDTEQLIQQLRSLNCIRVKGVVLTQTGPILIQGVGPRFECLPAPEHFPSHLFGHLVAIRRKHR